MKAYLLILKEDCWVLQRFSGNLLWFFTEYMSELLKRSHLCFYRCTRAMISSFLRRIRLFSCRDDGRVVLLVLHLMSSLGIGWIRIQEEEWMVSELNRCFIGCLKLNDLFVNCYWKNERNVYLVSTYSCYCLCCSCSFNYSIRLAFELWFQIELVGRMALLFQEVLQTKLVPFSFLRRQKPLRIMHVSIGERSFAIGMRFIAFIVVEQQLKVK